MNTHNTSILQKRLSWSLVAFLLFTLSYFFVGALSGTGVKPEMVIQSVKSKIDAVHHNNLEIINQVAHFFDGDSLMLDWDKGLKMFEQTPQTILLSKNGTVVFWNHADIPFDLQNFYYKGRPVVREFKSGWYLVEKKRLHSYDLWIFAKLQHQYNIHNNFLSNTNTALFSLPFNVRFSASGSRFLKPYDVYLNYTNQVVSRWSYFIRLFSFFLAYLSLLLFIYFSYAFLRNRMHLQRSYWLGIAFIIDVLLVRILDATFRFPFYIKQSPLFQISISTTPGFQSLGDLMLNILVAVFVLTGLKGVLKQRFLVRKGNFFALFFLSLVLFLLPYFSYALLDDALLNAGFNNLTNSIWINPLLLEKLGLILLVNGLIYFWVEFIIDYCKRSGVNLGVIYGMLFIVAVVLFLFFGFEVELFVLVVTFLSVLIGLIWLLDAGKNPYLFTIVLLVILAAAGSVLFNVTDTEIRNSHQRLTAELLSQKNDPYLEFRLREISPEIYSDARIQSLITDDIPVAENQLMNYLHSKYFNKYFSSYSIQTTLCQPQQKLAIQEDNKIMSCDQYFSSLDVKPVFVGATCQIYRVMGLQQSLYYLTRFKFPLKQETGDSLNLYIEFYKDFIPKGLGYPELLVDAQQTKLQLAGYSFARYSNGMLAFKFGDFLYPVDQTYFAKQQAGKFFYRDGYKHLIHQEGEDDYLIVSRPKTKISQYLLPFSLMFLFAGLSVLLGTIFLKNKQISKHFKYSMRTRLQLVFFSSVLLIFILLSVVTLYYFNEANQKRVESELKEKAHSVLIELQHKFDGDYEEALFDSVQVQNYLQKFSMVFFSDINLYDLSGKLLASSRPEIFSKGLQSNWMNPEAYYRIVKKHQLFFFSRERIGTMTFNSSYMPFILGDGRTVGVINLPYFARNTEIQRSYYQMMANLINLFVLTGIVGIIFMMFLSKILTKPLKLLQDKIRDVSIDRKNEMIDWKENDEIGQLIESYNQMVSKLEQSAELLKSSEREKAWREMARQIAHEIRNPLTPMKLNVQYLEKAYLEKDNQFDKKLKKISQTLISQIDTLNEVAGMFSDFSKTGLRKNQKADVLKALNDTLLLFRKSYEVHFDVKLPDVKQVLVNASEAGLVRIFTNIIKNAIQSMEGMMKKSIEIELSRDENRWHLKIRDFGKGISDLDKQKIFQPYFTTKSTGTGLGLAIVKNMMHEMGGSVHFETADGGGTEFHLIFPLNEK